jgi:putative ABC transport system permease protein
MFAHIFKMMWQRKRANSMIIIEIVVAFIVLLAVVAFVRVSYQTYSAPLGFEFDNTWAIQFEPDIEDRAKIVATAQRTLQILSQLPEVKGVHTTYFPPFIEASSSTTISTENGKLYVLQNSLTDGASVAMGMKLLAGRWLNESDSDPTIRSVVINKMLKENIFGEKDAINKVFDYDEKRKVRVVGVFEDFRQMGEFSPVGNSIIFRTDLNDPKSFFRSINIWVKSGTPRSFEETLQKVLHQSAPNWQFEVTTWEQLRDEHIKAGMVARMIPTVIALFLMLMVAFGLLGVLWQNVTRRTQELGLRRAMGATAGMVQMQIVFELLVITLMAIAIGFLIAIQIPISGVIEQLTWSIFFQSVGISTVNIMLLSVACAYYPSLIATRYLPADALHYE